MSGQLTNEGNGKLAQRSMKPRSRAKNWCHSVSETIRFDFEFTIHNYIFQRNTGQFRCMTDKFSPNETPNLKWMLEFSYGFPFLSQTNIDSPATVNVYLFKECGKNIEKLPMRCTVEITILKKSDQVPVKSLEKNFPTGSTLPLAYQLKVPRLDQDKMQDISPNGHLTIYCEIELLSSIKTVSGASSESSDSLMANSLTGLLNQMNDLFENKKLSDVTFNIGDEQIQAHKSILAARSSVFEAMFTHETKEKLSDSVDLLDVDVQVFNQFLRFIYTGQVDLISLQDSCIDILVTADKYMVNDLKKQCQQYLIDCLSTENALDFIVLAQKYSLDDLYSQTLSFLRFNFIEVKETENWKEIKMVSSSRWLCDIVENFSTNPLSSTSFSSSN